MVTSTLSLHCTNRVAVTVPLLCSVCFLSEQFRMSSFSLRFDRFWWCFLAVDFGFFFRWGVGSAHCICLHWRRVWFGLHCQRRRLGEEVKKGTLLRHVSQRVLCNMEFNYAKNEFICIPFQQTQNCPAQLSWCGAESSRENAAAGGTRKGKRRVMWRRENMDQ